MPGHDPQLLARAGAVAAAARAAVEGAGQARDPLLDAAASHDAPPPALLGYQQRWVADDAQLKLAEKGRRVGLTWAEAADDVTIAAREERPDNVMYISATQDMGREYIEAVALWARAFHYAASQIGEGLYDDGEGRFIKTFEVSFPNGKRVVALSSRPTNLRGKQGVVVIDEAAFHQDLAAMLKAALAMLLWGSKVRIISTHDGVENAFNQLIREVRAGKRGDATVHRIAFREAVAEGLYRRVCLRRGIAWSQAAEDKWVADAYAFYGDDAAEELDVVPSQSAGAYLSLTLIEQRMTNKPAAEGGPALVRGQWDDAFAYLPEDVRRFAILGWCEEQLAPHLARLSPLQRHVFAQDFARNRDQSIMVAGAEDTDLTRRPRITVELANCPFSSQQQILEYIVDRLPRFRGGAMDATGNGAALAEAAAQKYGVEMIEQVKLSDAFYLAHMPRLKAALQDGTLTDIPRDAALRDDLRAIKLIQGIPKIPRADTQGAAARAAAADGGAKQRRHGDFAIALFLMVYAFCREAGEIAWDAAPAKGSIWADDEQGDRRDDHAFAPEGTL
jgi:phage FluMu gp28-like protein